MNLVQKLQSLFQNGNLQKDSLVSLKPGQLLYGRVEKLLPNETAIIRIGDIRLSATLKAQLSPLTNYWFEVRTIGKDGLELKVVERIRQDVSADFFLTSQQLPNTKQNLQLVEFFLSKNLPFTKDQLHLAASWINNKTDSTTELTALEWMVKKELPFTKTTFQSLVAVQETQSLHHQLEELRSNLENPSFDSLKTIQTLKERITSLTKNHSTDEIGAAKEVKQMLEKQMLEKLVQSLGLNYENEVLSQANDKMVCRESLQSLKQLVMTAMTELGSNEKKILEPLLNRLTGLQLISQDLSGPMQQIIMQLPFAYGEKKSDITIQWNGQKTSQGKIDPDYCRIIFCLDLQSLNQTVVDMQIQNRVIHLSVINDSNEIEPIVKALTPSLKEKLESIGYTLSFIQVNLPFEKIGSEILQPINPVNLSQDFYHKVDRKI
jgi:hypothetical protein